MALRIRALTLMSVFCLGCAPMAAPTQRPPTASLEQGEVLRLIAALSTPVLRAPETPLDVLEERYAQAEGDARVALAGDVVRGRVAALEGLVNRRASVEAEAADAAAAEAEAEIARQRADARAARREREQPEEPHMQRREPAEAPAEAPPSDDWEEGAADEEWSEDGDDWSEDGDDDWGDEEADGDGWEDDDGWSSKKRRRDRRARRRDRRARLARARLRARQSARSTPPVEPVAEEQAEPQPAAHGPAAVLSTIDRQIARGLVSLEQLAAELPVGAPARAQAEFAVVWVAWRTESDDAARLAERFVDAHPGAPDLVALAWMLRAELTYEAEASLSALRFGANRLGEPVYAYSLWRAATIQQESGDSAAARESLLAVERAACQSDAPGIVRELGYAAAETLDHGVRRDDDGILRPDTCPANEAGEGWRPEE